MDVPPVATVYHLALKPDPTLTTKLGIGCPWHIATFIPVGGAILGHAQSGAVTVCTRVHAEFAALVTVIVTFVPDGMPVIIEAPTTPALLVTVPPLALYTTEYVVKSAEQFTAPICKVGNGVTVTTRLDVAVHPLTSVTVTSYVVVVNGLTMITDVC
jgi:hypothetical protein